MKMYEQCLAHSMCSVSGKGYYYIIHRSQRLPLSELLRDFHQLSDFYHHIKTGTSFCYFCPLRCPAIPVPSLNLSFLHVKWDDAALPVGIFEGLSEITHVKH